MAYDEDDDDSVQGEGLEPTPGNLAHWLEEQYQGDDRFEAIEISEPGPLEGESVRVRFICHGKAYFFMSVFEEDGLIRIGLATDDRELSEEIENSATDNGLSLTEFLQETLEIEDELEYEVQHFHDDMYYFCSEIPYQSEDELASDYLRDEIIYYLDGYMNAMLDLLEDEED